MFQVRCMLAAALWLLVTGCGGSGDEDDELDDLSVAEASLTPPFDSDVFDYTAEVANAVESITMTAVTEDAAATVTVNGVSVDSGAASQPIELAVGENTVSIVVTADDGDSQTYTVVVTRRSPPSSNPDLADLTLTGTELDQIFDPDVTSYTASIGYLGASVRVIAEPEDEGAALMLEDMALTAGEPSGFVPLAPGSNDLEIEVTAEDGSASRTYSVEVTRAEPVTAGQEAYLKASNTGPDLFGNSISIFDDTVVAGAPDEGSAASGVNGDESDDSLVSPGAAYVFERSGSTWRQTAYVKASNPGGPDRFGDAVAVHGGTALIGAPGEQSLATGVGGDQDDDSSSLVGAAYVFDRDGMGVWSQTAYLKASNAGQGDEFGRFVDLDGDRAIVGAWSEDGDAATVNGDGGNDNLPSSGAAYVFARDEAGEWAEEAYLKASNADAGDEFGRAVSIGGATAAVGARFEDSEATGVGGDGSSDFLSAAGAVYVFQRSEDGDWDESAYLKASNTDAGDRFGSSVAIDGDLLAVGAPGEDSAATGIDGSQQDDTSDAAGAVYVFERDEDGNWSQGAYIKASNTGFGDLFGSAVALWGNVLAVAARSENSGAAGLNGDELDDGTVDSGAVYLFERDAGGDWRQIAYVKSSNTDSNDEFGSAAALQGDTLAVGAELEASGATGVNGDASDDSVNDAGAAYIIR